MAVSSARMSTDERENHARLQHTHGSVEMMIKQQFENYDLGGVRGRQEWIRR